MLTDPLSPEIDSCRYLYLRRLWEPQDNHLCVIVDEAVVDAGDVPATATPVGPIIVGPQSRAFQLVWAGYVGYSVTNESYSVKGKADLIASGRLLVAYEASAYLDHLRHVTWDIGDVFGPIVHVRILCLNHTIDVVGFGPPVVQSVPPLRSE